MNTPEKRAAGVAPSRRVVSVLIPSCFVLASCGSTRYVSPRDYARLEPANNRHLEVSTADGEYRVSDFAFTDSTFVVKRLLEASYPMDPSKPQPPSQLPYSMPLQEVQSVSEVKYGWSTKDVIIGVGIVGAVVGLLVAIAEGLEAGPIDVF